SIRDLGYARYNSYINILAMDLEKYLQISNTSEAFDKLDEDTKSRCNVFDFLINSPNTRDILFECLWFFTVEKLEFDYLNYGFNVLNDEGKIIGFIDKENYEDIQEWIMRLNYLMNQDIRPKKFRNSKAKEIFNKIAKGKKKALKTKNKDDNMSLPNLICAVAAHHSSYNLNNIWSLTVYQLYDQFFRLNSKIHMDVISSRWAAYGKDDFDFSVWYRDINSNK
ncbi:MAG: hypothetical protein RSB38_05900, partial [Oscillospiraceae bacterium]